MNYANVSEPKKSKSKSTPKKSKSKSTPEFGMVVSDDEMPQDISEFTAVYPLFPSASEEETTPYADRNKKYDSEIKQYIILQAKEMDIRSNEIVTRSLIIKRNKNRADRRDLPFKHRISVMNTFIKTHLHTQKLNISMYKYEKRKIKLYLLIYTFIITKIKNYLGRFNYKYND